MGTHKQIKAPLERVHAWSSNWVQGSMSLDHVFSNCIGCLSAAVSSSNCAALCIQFSTETAQHIYQDIVQTVSASRPRLHLRSSSSTDYVLPQLHNKFGKCTFSHAGPSAWIRVPEGIHAEPVITNFRKLLKTSYFSSVF